MKKNNRIASWQIAVFAMLLTLMGSFSVNAQNALTKENIQKVLNDAYNKFKDLKEGKNADYIKELANVDTNIFGITLISTDGQIYTMGDTKSQVSIQSVSKVFTMAQVLEEQGHQAIQDKIGVDATGMRFNSIVAVEMQKGKAIHPL